MQSFTHVLKLCILSVIALQLRLLHPLNPINNLPQVIDLNVNFSQTSCCFSRKCFIQFINACNKSIFRPVKQLFNSC